MDNLIMGLDPLMQDPFPRLDPDSPQWMSQHKNRFF